MVVKRTSKVRSATLALIAAAIAAAAGAQDTGPLDKAKADAVHKRAPKAPASIENDVCRCVSPKKGRVG